MDDRRLVPLIVFGAAALGLLVLFISQRFASPRIEEGRVELDLGSPNDVPDPSTGDGLPDGYRNLLTRDAIPPIYAPTYRTADETDWPDDTLVLGVALEGEARAYPIRVLNHREMVLDRLGGTPILATW